MARAWHPRRTQRCDRRQTLAATLGHQGDELASVVEHADEPKTGTRGKPLPKTMIAGEYVDRHDAASRCPGTRGGTNSVILSTLPACSTTAGV